jgi:hypothetical protein
MREPRTVDRLAATWQVFEVHLAEERERQQQARQQAQGSTHHASGLSLNMGGVYRSPRRGCGGMTGPGSRLDWPPSLCDEDRRC